MLAVIERNWFGKVESMAAPSPYGGQLYGYKGERRFAYKVRPTRFSGVNRQRRQAARGEVQRQFSGA